MQDGTGRLAEMIAGFWLGPGPVDLAVLRDAVEALPAGVALVEYGPSGPPVMVARNALHQQITGATGPSAVPLDGTAFEMYRPDRTTRLPRDEYPGARALREGRTVAGVGVHLRRLDGTWRVLTVSATPLPVTGEVRRVLVVLLDVTEGYDARREVEAQAVLAQALVANAEDAILTVGTDRRILSANPAVRRVFGWAPEEMLGRESREFMHPEDVPVVAAASTAVGEGGVARLSHRILFRDGTPRFVEAIFKRLDQVPGIGGWVVSVRDVTVQRALEARARQTNRALLTLSRCNEALVRATSEEELFRLVSRVIVEEGGYVMCWVGLLEHDEAKTVRPVAWAGKEAGYLTDVLISWGDDERGRGPTGTAARTNEVVVAQDFEGNPRLAPWREAARRRGYRSSSAIPLAADGQVFGVISMYAPESEAFAGDELTFLVQLAKDLAFGVLALRHRRERARAEEELRRSRAELRALAARLDAVREDEKARIARDLHDEMGQLLTGLRIDLDLLEEKLSELPPGPLAGALVDRVVDASSLVTRVIAAMRQAVAVLRPAALDRLGLAAALRQECREFGERTGIACRVQVPDLLELRPDAETALFRIAQEALTNVARHAGARQVEVSIRVDGSAVLLRVIDDGKGLPASVRRGLGIVGMRERAERLGGTLEIVPGPGGGGAVVAARLPAGRAEPGGNA